MFTLTSDPVFPWSIPVAGPIALAATVMVITALTMWTYQGAQVSTGRKAVIVALRLIALLLAAFTVLRPALTWQDEERLPSKLIIAVDSSKSMTVADEANSRSRWAAIERILRNCNDAFHALQKEHNVTIELHRFADDVTEKSDDIFSAAEIAQIFGKSPIGSRTDFGQMLKSLSQKYGQERALRGLVILSDGADNGTRYPALAEASRYRAINCPVFTFSLGQESTSVQQRDVGIRAMIPDPSPVAVKGKLTVRVIVDAPGYENSKSILRLYFDGKDVASQEVQFRQPQSNELFIEATAPATPGEIKLTARIDPLPGEASTLNNEMTTYLTVSREGLSVLYVDRLRPERIGIIRALSGDPRMRVFAAVRQTDDPVSGGEISLYDFARQGYDVIIIGDVPARRFAAGQPDVLAKIDELVRAKGTGLLMIGGQESFAGGGWQGTKVGDALPVVMDAMGDTKELVRMQPAKTARSEYLMRIGADAAASEQLWKKLPALDGFSKMGRRKDGAVVLGETVNGVPLFVRQDYGKGRTAALAIDMTHDWMRYGLPRSTEGLEIHARFWRQMMLYLAHQEETEGSVWIKPEARRVPVGGKVPFTVGVRGKTGMDLPDATFEVRAIMPDNSAVPNVPVTKEKDTGRGAYWKTDHPGEYQLLVKASAKDVDGTPVSDEAKARFLVYEDDTELLRPAADHQFLARLAAAGDGHAFPADELPRFLTELPAHPIPGASTKTHYWPDWRTTHLSLFPPLLLAVFVALLTAEWGLRRYWGLV